MALYFFKIKIFSNSPAEITMMGREGHFRLCPNPYTSTLFLCHPVLKRPIDDLIQKMIYAPRLRFSGLEVTRLTTLVFTDINNLELYGNIPGYKVDKCSKVRCGHPIDAYVEYFSIQMTWHLKGKVSEAVSEWVRRLINITNYRTSAPIEALEMKLNVPLGNIDRPTDRQTDLQERVEDLQIGVALA